MGNNPPPHGKNSPPPAQNHPCPPRGAKAAAKRAFQAAHLALFGTPSGTVRWHITLSKNPNRWFYQAEEKTGRPFGNTGSGYSGIATGAQTDLTVTACISWIWADILGGFHLSETAYHPDHRWLEAIAQLSRLTNLNMIALGAEPITPPAPADTAWQVRCLRTDINLRYHARVHLHTALALGDTLLLTPAPGTAAGAALTEHIRQRAIARLRGTTPPLEPFPHISVYPNMK